MSETGIRESHRLECKQGPAHRLLVAITGNAECPQVRIQMRGILTPGLTQIIVRIDLIRRAGVGKAIVWCPEQSRGLVVG